jgi:peptidoglycan/xylan/chitin deacetylase (PgdA/CDA1 family)
MNALLTLLLFTIGAGDPRVAIIESDTSCVRMGCMTTIRVNPQCQPTDGWTYAWAARRGTIEGSGGAITYKASMLSAPGYDFVTCSISGVLKVVVVYTYRQFAIIKADDFQWPTDRWKRFADYLKSRRIKWGLGVIAARLDPLWNHRTDYAAGVAYLKTLQMGGVELWMHGYDHSASPPNSYEFWYTTAESQALHFTRAQGVATDVLGAPFTTFGAPGNLTDASTATIVNADPNIRVWFHGGPVGSDKMLLRLPATFSECPTGVPNYAQFAAGYRADIDPVVLQFHPDGFATESAWTEFGRIIDFLVAKGVTFIKPTEFYNCKQKGSFPSV